MFILGKVSVNQPANPPVINNVLYTISDPNNIIITLTFDGHPIITAETFEINCVTNKTGSNTVGYFSTCLRNYNDTTNSIELQIIPADSSFRFEYNNRYKFTFTRESFTNSSNESLLLNAANVTTTPQNDNINFQSFSIDVFLQSASNNYFDILDNSPYFSAINVSVNSQIEFKFDPKWHVVGFNFILDSPNHNIARGNYYPWNNSDNESEIQIYIKNGQPQNPTITSSMKIFNEWLDSDHSDKDYDVEIWKDYFIYRPVPVCNLDIITGLPISDYPVHSPQHSIGDNLEYNTTYELYCELYLDPTIPDTSRATRTVNGVSYNVITLFLKFTTAAEGKYSYSGGTGMPGTDSCEVRTGVTGGTGQASTDSSTVYPGGGGNPGLWTYCKEKGGTGGTGGTGRPGKPGSTDTSDTTGDTGRPGESGSTDTSDTIPSIKSIKSYSVEAGEVTVGTDEIIINLSANPLQPNTLYTVDLSKAILKDSFGNIIPTSDINFTFKTSGS